METENNEIRISRYLAMSGVASRRKSEEIVLAGKIKVNGKTVKDLSFRINPEDIVEYDGKKISYENKVVIALNKPPGYLSTVNDNFKRKTVLDLLDEKIKTLRLYPAGRLDYNSRGLIILTNDGNLAYTLTHPGFNIPKAYQVKIRGCLSDDDIIKIKKGIDVDGRDLIAESIKIVRNVKDNCTIEIKIKEGRKRIIRKALLKIGHAVIDLQRISIGKFNIGKIKEGSYILLSQKDITQLKSN
jgi:23S rRNA pseudouridine2605 synthase